jgi:hypothetical protein
VGLNHNGVRYDGLTLWRLDIILTVMTWTQLTLRLPGGIRIELWSLHKPPVATRPSLPPPACEVIQTHGEELPDNVIPIRRAS